MNAADLPDLMTIREAAAFLRISLTTAYELAHQWRATDGKRGLPVIRVGRALRVPKAALLRLLSENPTALGLGRYAELVAD